MVEQPQQQHTAESPITFQNWYTGAIGIGLNPYSSGFVFNISCKVEICYNLKKASETK